MVDLFTKNHQQRRELRVWLTLVVSLTLSGGAPHPIHAQSESQPASVLKNEILARMKGSAERGDREAQYRLGLAFHQGQGVVRDPVDAAKWIRKAAPQGHTAAQ